MHDIAISKQKFKWIENSIKSIFCVLFWDTHTEICFEYFLCSWILIFLECRGWGGLREWGGSFTVYIYKISFQSTIFSKIQGFLTLSYSNLWLFGPTLSINPVKFLFVGFLSLLPLEFRFSRKLRFFFEISSTLSVM